jgi:hypothetical protein
MSQVLKEMPTWAEDVDALGRPAKYPWRDWLDGETHLLVRTTDEYEGDYQTESRFFRHTVIRAAEKRNIEVFVAVHSGRHYEDKRDRMIIKAEDQEAQRDFQVPIADHAPIDEIPRPAHITRAPVDLTTI